MKDNKSKLLIMVDKATNMGKIRMILLLLVKIMKLIHLEDVQLRFFYLAVNKLITGNTQNLFSLIAKHYTFIEYSLNKLNWII